jgi:hypothetical protein
MRLTDDLLSQRSVADSVEARVEARVLFDYSA